MMQSREEIEKRLKELLGSEKAWSASEEEEYDDLIESYPVENDEDEEFLLDMGEMAFLKVVRPQP